MKKKFKKKYFFSKRNTFFWRKMMNFLIEYSEKEMEIKYLK
jgi:hypothetical protein